MIRISSDVKVAGRVNSFNHAIDSNAPFSLLTNLGNSANASYKIIDIQPDNLGSTYILIDTDVRNRQMVGNTPSKGITEVNSAGLDGTFNTNILNDSTTVFGTGFGSVVTQSDGKLIALPNRYNADGTRDNSFNIGSFAYATGIVKPFKSTVIQSDGKILVGGSVDTISASQTGYLTRLETNGNRDTTWKNGGGFTSSIFTNPAIQSLKIRPDGKIIVAGILNFYSGSTKNYSGSVLLNANGDIDTNFNPSGSFTGSIGKNPASTDYPTCVEVEPNNKMTFFGYFTLYQSQSCGGVIKLSPIGAVDPTFKSGSFSQNALIAYTAREPNGKIIAVGNFTSYSGSTANRIVRITPSGSIDPDFKSGLGFNNTVYSVKLDSSGSIYCTGIFSSYSGSQEALYDGIIKLNPSGSIDTTFNPYGLRVTDFTSPITNDSWNIRQIITASLGGYYVIGRFDRIGDFNYPFPGFVKLNPDLSISSSLVYSGSFSSTTPPYAIVQQSDRKLIFGGNFTTYKGLNTNRIIRANEDLSIDTSFKTGSGFNNSVLSLAIDSTTQKIYAGGKFTSYSGSALRYLVRINTDGSVDTTFSSSMGTSFDLNGFVYKITTQTDGKILVGGTFSSFNGNTSEGIVRLNSDGTYDTTFKTNGGVSSGGDVYSIVSQSDGKILISGIFTTYSGSSYSQDIVRVDSSGAIDPTFSSGPGLTGSAAGVNPAVILSTFQNDDGSYLIGYSANNYSVTGKLSYSGSILMLDNGNASQIFKINSNGTLVPTQSFNCPLTGELTSFDDTYVSSFIRDSDGGVIIGGAFREVSGSTQQYIAKIDPNSGAVWKNQPVLY